MSFGQYETSADQGEPILLALFRFGDGALDYYAYTDSEQTFPFEGIDYLPTSLGVGEINSSGTLDNSTLSITVPENLPLIDIFRLRPPSDVVTLTLRQGHANDPDAQFLVGWSGKVIAFEVDGDNDTATLGCEPISISMRRTMLRRHWQYGCPLPLFGPDCRANRAAATSTHTVVSTTGAIVVLAPTWATADRRPKYEGGVAEWLNPDGRRMIRRIIRCDADGTVVLATTADELVAGQPIQMVLGCNHKTGLPTLNDGGDCHPLHNNIKNFGGDPWIPTENPVGIKNNYY